MKTTFITLSVVFVVILGLGAIQNMLHPKVGDGTWDLVNAWPGDKREQAGTIYVSGLTLHACQAAKRKWERTDPSSSFGCQSR